MQQTTIYKAIFGFALNVISSAVMKIWPDIDWFSWPLLFAGICLLIWAATDFVTSYLKLALYSNWSFNFISVLPFKILIRLDRAAYIAYEKLRNTDYGRAYAQIEKNNGGEILQTFACGLVDNTPLYGKRPPLKSLDLIDQDSMGVIDNGGKSTHYINGDLEFDELMIEKKRLNQYIRATKKKFL